MDFFTYLKAPKSSIDISHQDYLILFGSCFAESIGNRLAEHKFQVDINPFGVLYNPKSILTSIRSLLTPLNKTKDDLFYHEGLFHSFSHHSSFSDISETACLTNINSRIKASADNLNKATRLLITFGTAFVYNLKKTGEVVANCHKLPAGNFEHRSLSVTEIVNEWHQLLSVLFERNKKLKIIFTVSPIRYWKDGAHENQLSKATLLLAINELQKQYPEQISYFPAYELMMDELRDYRFYAEDMFHPSETAIQYIWEYFSHTYMNQPTQQLTKEIENILRLINHKPFNPQSESYKQFVTQTLLKIEQFNRNRPYLCFKKEVEILKKNIQDK
ncbi:MAG: GSCFA domain-containing protein [Tannerella sp.]|jgi:hypothetical protein|nr:GSCFA domain-containing protein [Tannerella sp.]